MDKSGSNPAMFGIEDFAPSTFFIGYSNGSAKLITIHPPSSTVPAPKTSLEISKNLSLNPIKYCCYDKFNQILFVVSYNPAFEHSILGLDNKLNVIWSCNTRGMIAKTVGEHRLISYQFLNETEIEEVEAALQNNSLEIESSDSKSSKIIQKQIIDSVYRGTPHIFHEV